MPRTNKKKPPRATAGSNKMAKKQKKPSPDSIVCIDLTNDTDVQQEQERRLGTIRKELEPHSAKKRKSKKSGTGGLKTTGLEIDDDDDNDVIVLDSDDDDGNSDDPIPGKEILN